MQKVKRIAVFISTYVFVDENATDQEIYDEAQKKCQLLLDDDQECDAEIEQMRRAPYGDISEREIIDLKKLKIN